MNRASLRALLPCLFYGAIAVALSALGWYLTPDLDGAELRAGELPPGVVAYPSEPDTYCKLIEFSEPGDVLVQGPLPNFSLWTPVLKDNGKLAIITGKTGDYNVLVFPASGTPRVKGFTINLGPIKPPTPTPPPNPAPTLTATVSPLSIELGQSAKVMWAAKNATACTLDGQTVPVDGSQEVKPAAAGDVTYTLTATGKGGRATKTVKLTVTAPPKPTRLYGVIWFESGQDLKPDLADVLRGKQLQDWWKQQGWTDSDGTPSLIRTDQDNEIGSMVADKAKWGAAAIAAGKASGKPLPVLVWAGAPDGPWAVEPCEATADKQIERLKAIAGK